MASRAVTKRDLEQELDEAYDRIEELESYISDGQDLLSEDEDLDEGEPGDE